MDIPAYNRAAWNQQCREGTSPWCQPVDADEIQAAREGRWSLLLTPNKAVPQAWLGDVAGKQVLCLASGGGQQAPVLAAAGAVVTSFDNSEEQLAKDRLVADRDGLALETVRGDMADLSVFPEGSFDLIFHAVSNVFAEGATGVVTQTSGNRSLGEPQIILCEGMAEALDKAEAYLQAHKDHEAWIGGEQTSYRITLPAMCGFMPWIDSYRRQGHLGPIRPRLSFGEVISMLGFPIQCSLLRTKSPLAVILRYLPGPIDFHFDAGGLLWLAHDDNLDEPRTILSL